MKRNRVRLLRLIEYVGPYEDVVRQVANSLHGTRAGVGNCRITAVTIGEFPELLLEEPDDFNQGQDAAGASPTTREEPSS